MNKGSNISPPAAICVRGKSNIRIHQYPRRMIGNIVAIIRADAIIDSIVTICDIEFLYLTKRGVLSSSISDMNILSPPFPPKQSL